MRRILALLCLLAAAASALVVSPAALNRAAAAPPARAAASDVLMTSRDKKARAAVQKLKTSRAASKRFKATATGKLLRRKAFKSHILTKKHPLRKQRMRRISQVDDSQLKTMQVLLGVVPKRP